MDAVAATLHFLDVQQSCVPATSVGAFWLYEEIDVSPLGGFRLDVLLDTDEIMIVAADVRVELVFGLP